MQIEVTGEVEQRLRQHAAASGYDDVEKYAADHLAAIAYAPLNAELPPMSEDELRRSAEMCDQGMADVLAGRVMSVEEARQRLHSRLGKQRA